MRAAAVALALLLAPGRAQDAPPRWTWIDDEIEKKLQADRLRAAPPADDLQFVRRAHLDLVGRLPRPEPARDWLASKEPDKRGRLIDSLLASPEFNEFWAEAWVRTLLGFDVFNLFRQDISYGKLRDWLQEQFARNRPYDQIVTELITAQGHFNDSGPVNFLMSYVKQDTKQPVEAAVAVSRVFLGYPLQCAQCHDHPFAKWSKAEFWGFTALLARTKQRVTNTFDGVKIRLVEKESGELKTDDGVIAPRFLDGQAPPAEGSRREALARWVVSNPQFARATVNRIWAHLMGRGLVEPIDNFVESNPPTHPELLQKLADAFARSGYDLKRLIGEIARSRAYQRTSRSRSGERREALYTHQAVRPMHPVALLNSLFFALGAEAYVKNEEFQKGRYLFFYFIQALMGQNARSDRATYEGSAQQALVFMNNKDFNAALHAPGGIVDGILSKAKSPRDRVTAIFFVLLSRAPTDAELRRYETYLKEKKESREAYQDIYWVLLNSSEFFFNH